MECYGNGKGTKSISVDHIDQNPLNNRIENIMILLNLKCILLKKKALILKKLTIHRNSSSSGKFS